MRHERIERLPVDFQAEIASALRRLTTGRGMDPLLDVLRRNRYGIRRNGAMVCLIDRLSAGDRRRFDRLHKQRKALGLADDPTPQAPRAYHYETAALGGPLRRRGLGGGRVSGGRVL